jgi:hypothetical protein
LYAPTLGALPTNYNQNGEIDLPVMSKLKRGAEVWRQDDQDYMLLVKPALIIGSVDKWV